MTTYPSSELNVFKDATVWKTYWSRFAKDYVIGDILDVGAGLGVNIDYLWNPEIRTWTCLEPDPGLAMQIKARSKSPVSVVVGSIDQIPAQPNFDCILYIDVLEHIEHDSKEIEKALIRLKKGGTLVILVPAHQWLMSPFDRNIGHYRRYSSTQLCKLMDRFPLELVNSSYLDSVGITASLVNRMFLKQSEPTRKQIAFWDRRLVPLSQFLDKLLFYKIGKSVLGIWKKT